MPFVICFRLDVGDGTGFAPNMASLFHGFLHERLSAGYAAKMHITGLHPFTQCLLQSGGEWLWRVTALNDEAAHELSGALDGLDMITLSNKELTIPAHEITRGTKSYDELFTENYLRDAKSRYVRLAFVTPTAFRSAGRYVNMPSAPLILGSLVRKYDAFSESTEVGSEELFMQLSRDTEITAYALRSCAFSLEGVKIPAFRGSVTVRVSGSQTFVNFVNMLAEFAEFSGCGIKTALGMGGVIHIRNEARSIE
jgi:CRISPR-associated endoribonuclease Cas6